jgi:hypothetical protein
MVCQCPPHSGSDRLDIINLSELTDTLADLFTDSLASENLTDSFVSAQFVLNNKYLSNAYTRVRPVNLAVGSSTLTFKPIYVVRGSSPFRFVDIGNEEYER